MPFTSGEIGIGALLSMAFAGFGKWIGSISGRSERLEKRICLVEKFLPDKITRPQLTEHCRLESDRLSDRVKETHSLVETLAKSMAKLHLQVVESEGAMRETVLTIMPKIKELGTKINTENEMLEQRLDARIQKVEETVKEI